MSTETETVALTPRTIRHAIADVRWSSVDRFVNRRVNDREGDFTNDEIEAWTQEAVTAWNERNPVLIGLWRAISEGRVTIEVAASGEER